MAISVFQKLKAQKIAQKMGVNTESDLAIETDNPVLTGLLNDFRIDLEQSRKIESTSSREEFKADRLDHYRPWVEGILSNEALPYDKITTEMAVWSIDAGDVDYAINIARYMMNGQHELPPVFNEATSTALLRLFTDKAAKEPELVSLGHLQQLEELFVDVDVKDTVRAKLYRYIAERLSEDDPVLAIEYYEKVLVANSGETIKTALNTLKKQVIKNSES